MIRWRLKRDQREKEIDGFFYRGKDQFPNSVRYLLNKVIKEICGTDFEATTEYEEWLNECYELRNSIVHGTKENVTREETLRAIETTNNARDLLQALLNAK